MQTVAELLFYSYNFELWPVTLTFKLDLDAVKMNQHAKYLGQREVK